MRPLFAILGLLLIVAGIFRRMANSESWCNNQSRSGTPPRTGDCRQTSGEDESVAFLVGGRFKTGQLWSNQNQPLLLFKSKEGVLASSD
jgi:hypothetical protein